MHQGARDTPAPQTVLTSPQLLTITHRIVGGGVGQVGMLEGAGVAKFGGERESEQVADSADVPADGVDLTKKAVLPQIP